MEEDDYGEDFEIPLEQKRAFGSGLKRKRIDFVRASDADLRTIPATKENENGSSVADFYLSLVLPEEKRAKTEPPPNSPQVCAVCNLPVTEDEALETLNEGNSTDTAGGKKKATPKQKHDASIAHQVCVTHSHPPSALDRSRMGLAYLSSYGWDPDARQGLGAAKQGMQYPLKPNPKDDKLGLGLEVPKHVKERVVEKKPKQLDAKQRKAKVEAEKKKAERLKDMFYGSDDLQRYLGRG
jgi:hypothetical protein